MAALEDLHLDVMKDGASVYDFPGINHQLIDRLLCGVHGHTLDLSNSLLWV